MSTWVLCLIVSWLSFGLGSLFTGYLFLTAKFMDDSGRIHVEQHEMVMSPQEFLRRQL